MNETNLNGSTGKFIAGLLIGSVCGAVLGALWASEKGSGIRSRVKEDVSDLEKKFKEKYDQVKTEFSDFEDPEKNYPV